MMTRIAILIMLVLVSINAAFIIYTYKLEDEIKDIHLPNVEGEMVSLEDYTAVKGFLIIFTSNECLYSKLYEERIIALHNKYGKDYPVVAINSIKKGSSASESFESMQKRAKDKNYQFQYLYDESQHVARIFGANKVPQVYLIQRQHEKNVIKYVGSIDDSPMNGSDVKTKYIDAAIQALNKGKEVKRKETRVVGCSIDFK
jgi:peroxiredoxin